MPNGYVEKYYFIFNPPNINTKNKNKSNENKKNF